MTEYMIVAEHPGIRLDRFLATKLPELTRTRIQALIAEGFVQCNGAPLSLASQKTKLGDTYTLHVPDAVESHLIPQDISLEIIYEDDSLLVINKAAGMVVHPAVGHRQDTLVNALMAHCGEALSGIGGVKRPGIVHRLDKDTSGLMVVAKTDQAHQALAAQFADRTLSRLYWAFVWGEMPKIGIYTSAIGRSRLNRQKMAVLKSGGKPAETCFERVAIFRSEVQPNLCVSFIECKLMTGRTHQIRVHLTNDGHPLIGDPTYGKTPKGAVKAFPEFVVDFPRQALHAHSLSFMHPRTEKLMTFTCPLPADLMALKNYLMNLN